MSLLLLAKSILKKIPIIQRKVEFFTLMEVLEIMQKSLDLSRTETDNSLAILNNTQVEFEKNIIFFTEYLNFACEFSEFKDVITPALMLPAENDDDFIKILLNNIEPIIGTFKNSAETFKILQVIQANCISLNKDSSSSPKSHISSVSEIKNMVEIFLLSHENNFMYEFRTKDINSAFDLYYGFKEEKTEEEFSRVNFTIDALLALNKRLTSHYNQLINNAYSNIEKLPSNDGKPSFSCRLKL